MSVTSRSNTLLIRFRLMFSETGVANKEKTPERLCLSETLLYPPAENPLRPEVPDWFRFLFTMSLVVQASHLHTTTL